MAASPPYNIARLDENHFQISVALAGFTPDEVALTVEQIVLTLEGRKGEKEVILNAVWRLTGELKIYPALWG